MRTKTSKQFLMLENKPILIHTLLVFESHPDIDEIVVVTQAKELEETQKWIRQYQLSKVTYVLQGGKERQDSVYEGLQMMKADLVLVHDAVRPFVSHDAIDRILEAVKMHGAAILAVPVKDTIKQVDQAGIVEMTPDRNRLWAVQTPQAFRYQLLWEAHKQAKEQQILATDDSMLVEELGIDVRVVMGEYTNLKLTTPEDLFLAEIIYKARSQSE
ncbi:2-C-methyl-D-erythritol 4-phosphate cytidylyltransferase [Thermoflavimicrobium daqui]|uniref:2-C-methyl-D-erythritol 4-phosphate cytidylyltransferase n=1 Tax=Thermoflavimicrobium daqui TaxID=2137476 RepID=A0A364K3K9_9BACL|nr:2-C-methyl-D-erythritol 4-phosphate cytidylyltransferase [Thermoflavimicrobium daqui]RAL23306.1 2-C-methyl-D-erythritol 4-phosphate cytidylyltransferase [Thermoflavimicrobium daqui]